MRKTKSPHRTREPHRKSSRNGAPAIQNGKPPQALISAKNRRLKKLVQSWLDDESGYDEETWPWLKKALEEDRLSARRLFRVSPSQAIR